jgi:hypothetical protein
MLLCAFHILEYLKKKIETYLAKEDPSLDSTRVEMVLDMPVSLFLVILEGDEDVFTSARLKVIQTVCQNRRILHCIHCTYYYDERSKVVSRIFSILVRLKIFEYTSLQVPCPALGSSYTRKPAIKMSVYSQKGFLFFLFFFIGP